MKKLVQKFSLASVLMSATSTKAQAATTIILAQAGGFNQAMGQAVGIINAICLVLVFGGLVAAAVMYMTGRTEVMKHALVGAAVAGLSWVIVNTFFSAGGQTANIQIQAPQ